MPSQFVFAYRFIDFYSGFSPGQVCGGKGVKRFCVAGSILIMSPRHFSLVMQIAALKIFLMNDMFKFCMHTIRPTQIKSLPILSTQAV